MTKDMPTLLLRAESKPFETRSLLSPSAVSTLCASGYRVLCERWEDRCFSDIEMERAGAELVESRSWIDAPVQTIIIGLKELDSREHFPLKHTHVHFAHVFKGQEGWEDVLLRYAKGQGFLLDIEFITDPLALGHPQRLLNPSSYHAGLCGALLAVHGWALQNVGHESVSDMSAPQYNSEADAAEKTWRLLRQCHGLPTVMVVGSRGKCGAGAVDICERLGLKVVQIGRAESAAPDFPSRVLDVHILINCIYLSDPIKPFVSHQSIRTAAHRKLSMIADVSCDGDAPTNPVAVYQGHTTFQKPYMPVPTPVGPTLHVVAIDHLPSLIPKDASEYCATQLLPYLLQLHEWKTCNDWRMARTMFRERQAQAIMEDKVRQFIDSGRHD